MNGVRSVLCVSSWLLVAVSAALACSYGTSVCEPAHESDPPFYPVGIGDDSGWIDGSGRRIQYEPQWRGAQPVELVPFERDSLFGYSRSGMTVVEPRFVDARPFDEGRARVVLDGPCVPVWYCLGRRYRSRSCRWM
jgi:hypothetical protein